MPRSRSNSIDHKCRHGEIYRVGYVRNQNDNDIYVPGKCIRSTSQSKQKRSSLDAEYIRGREKMHNIARERFSKSTPKKCSGGKILREGYYRKPYTRSTKRAGSIEVKGAWVPPTCVPNINAVKKKQLFVLEPDVLGKYGYHDVANKTERQRHIALKRALKAGIEPLPLLRRVNALAVVNKNKNPDLSRVFKADVEYVRNTAEYINRPTRSRSK